jgi:hypothetical protein
MRAFPVKILRPMCTSASFLSELPSSEVLEGDVKRAACFNWVNHALFVGSLVARE